MNQRELLPCIIHIGHHFDIRRYDRGGAMHLNRIVAIYFRSMGRMKHCVFMVKMKPEPVSREKVRGFGSRSISRRWQPRLVECLSQY